MVPTIPGEVLWQQEEPDWTGLEALLPLSLCGPFMWMGPVRLADGTMLGQYKHHTTRRYLFLEPDGTTWAYRDGDYCRVRHHDAIEHVFDPWWILEHATDEDKDALRVALEGGVERDHRDYERGLSLPAVRI